MGRIILNLAISLDGYISDPDGGFDWIVGQGDNTIDTEKTFDMAAFMESIEILVMGSKAYEDVVLSGLENFADKRIVVATTRELEGRDNVEFIQGDLCKQIMEMKAQTDGDIWLFGGAGSTDPFVKANLVDEYIIAIIPTILGNGRRLFSAGYPKIDLHLDEVNVNDGITVMRYSRRSLHG